MFDSRFKSIASIFTAIAALSLAPSVAMATEGEATTTASTKPADAAHDANGPDKMICRTVEVIGSRLKSGRVCMTSQQWAAKKQEDRDALQRGQTQRWKSE